jgi:hypothetical protein
MVSSVRRRSRNNVVLIISVSLKCTCKIRASVCANAVTLFEISVRLCWHYYVELPQYTGRVFLCLLIMPWRRVGEWRYSSSHSKLHCLLIDLSISLYERQNIYTSGVFITLANHQLDAQCFYFIIFLLQSSTCFEQRRAHHQEIKLFLYIIWYGHSVYVASPLARPEWPYQVLY